jgi:hypothetical protein
MQISVTHSLGEIASGQGGEVLSAARAGDGRRHDERVNNRDIGTLERIAATPPKTFLDEDA